MRRMLSRPMVIGVLVALVLAATTVSASPGRAFPDLIPLPDGFAPEGIAAGQGTTFYVGGLFGGAIYRGDLRTGEGAVLVEPLFVGGVPAQAAVGLAFDRRANVLFVAGGPLGTARAYDGGTGELLATYAFTEPDPDPFNASVTFVNDVIVTRDAVYFTDSFRPFLYRVPLGAGGRLPDPGSVEELALGGDWTQVAGFNANGIEATPDGRRLIVVNTSTGDLFTVDPATGEATRIDLDGGSVGSGDGILLSGRTLYVVQNFLNQIAVVELAPDLASGTIVDVMTHSDFRIPTTIAEHGAHLYAVNARFDTAPAPDVEYDVVKVRKP